MLSPETISEFKLLYFKEFGIRLSDEHTLNYATKLLGLVKLIYGSQVPKKWVSLVDKKKSGKIG